MPETRALVPPVHDTKHHFDFQRNPDLQTYHLRKMYYTASQGRFKWRNPIVARPYVIGQFQWLLHFKLHSCTTRA
jgi:hypothetical protein